MMVDVRTPFTLASLTWPSLAIRYAQSRGIAFEGDDPCRNFMLDNATLLTAIENPTRYVHTYVRERECVCVCLFLQHDHDQDAIIEAHNQPL